jgi:hypothetical protein
MLQLKDILGRIVWSYRIYLFSCLYVPTAMLPWASIPRRSQVLCRYYVLILPHSLNIVLV